MKRKINSIIISVFIALGSVLAVAMPAFAETATDLGGNDSAAGNQAKETSFSFGECGTSDVGIECLVDEVLTFLTVLVGIAVVGGITVGGITYSMSRGNPANTQKGIKIITNSVIGLILYFLMFAIINFLVPGGIFN